MALSACNTETDSAGRELTVHGTAAFPIACYHDDLEAAPVPWHWHEELELLIASEGGVLAAAAGEKYTLAEGDGLFINAGVLHADWPLAVGRCRLHSVVFHPRLVGGSPDSVFWQKYLQPLLTDPSRPCAVLRPTVDWQHEAIEDMERAPRGGERNPRLRVQDPRGAVGDDLPAGQPRSGGAGPVSYTHLGLHLVSGGVLF